MERESQAHPPLLGCPGRVCETPPGTPQREQERLPKTLYPLAAQPGHRHNPGTARARPSLPARRKRRQRGLLGPGCGSRAGALRGSVVNSPLPSTRTRLRARNVGRSCPPPKKPPPFPPCPTPGSPSGHKYIKAAWAGSRGSACPLSPPASTGGLLQARWAVEAGQCVAGCPLVPAAPNSEGAGPVPASVSPQAGQQSHQPRGLGTPGPAPGTALGGLWGGVQGCWSGAGDPGLHVT